MYICQAGKDHQGLTIEEIMAGINVDGELWKLHMWIEITIGMKVMVTVNILTDADLTNGMRGVTTDIILDHREHLDGSKVERGEITLLYPPAMIVFKPLRTSCPKFDGLQQGVIPLFPTSVSFHILTSAYLDPFSTYVMLSCSRGCETIRLLGDFDDNLFTKHPSENLRQEDSRLAELTVSTKEAYDNGPYN